MKNLLCSCLLVPIIIVPSLAQFSIQSLYLQEPNRAIGYVDSCAAFWLNAYDSDLGGFFTNIDKYGNVITAWGTNKNMLTQTRDAYGFVRAYMLTGNDVYLSMAAEALDFMYAHAWDSVNGGWFGELDLYGAPIHPTADKTAFDQHYALLGITAYCEATGDTLDQQWLATGYNHNEDVYWDNRPDYLGYYDEADFDGSNPRGKSFNATVDAITTNLLYQYLMSGDPLYEARLLQLARQIIDHMVASMEDQAIGFVEEYDSEWNGDAGETMTIMGHVLKAAWCLGRVYQFNADTAYVPAAAQLILDVWENGYDHDFGGPYKDYNRITGEMMMWGNPDTAKAWWQMEQAVVAGLQWFDITGDSLFLRMADETLSFFMDHFVDHQYSEVYENRTRYGDATWGENKGNAYKAGYHSIELGYYVYLYGKLFLTHEPAVLNYRFIESSAPREIRLNPLAMADSLLKISSVLWEGEPYTSYDADLRLLNLPGGVGGRFQVTYERVEPVAFAGGGGRLLPASLTLLQNYPNPFNAVTTIPYNLPSRDHAVLTLFDISGRKVRTLMSGMLGPAAGTVIWDGRDEDGREAASGVYLAQFNAGRRSATAKLILLR